MIKYMERPWSQRTMCIVAMAVLRIVFCQNTVTARTDEWPTTLRWWPGSYWRIVEARMSTDGKFVTLMSDIHLAVVDVQTKVCVFTLEYAVLFAPNFRPDWKRRLASISESGDEFVFVNPSGRLEWYHVGDTLPWRYHDLNLSPFGHVRMLDDTTALGDRGSEVVVCRAGQDTPEIITTGVPVDQWVKDSLAYVEYEARDSIGFINPYDSSFYSPLIGKVAGIDESGLVVVLGDKSIYRYDVVSEARTLILDSIQNSRIELIRRRFIPLGQEVLDLRDGSRSPNSVAIKDMLHDGTMLGVGYDYNPEICIVWTNAVRDSIPVLIGPLFSHTQDPRDSTIYASIGSIVVLHSGGRLGGFASIASNEIWTTGVAGSIADLGPFRKIRDTSVVFFTDGPDGTSGPGSEGYMSFEVFRSKGPTRRVEIWLETKNGLIEHFIRFSDKGDTLSVANDGVKAGGCRYPVLGVILENSSATGFVPGTDYYVLKSSRYSYHDCADKMALPFRVISLSGLQDRVIGETPSSLIMSSVADPTVRYASVNAQRVLHETWSQNGKTFRFTDDGRNVTSMYSNGRIEKRLIPFSYSADSSAKWWWSHDGSVLTVHSDSAIATIDIETGDVLREYENIPWIGSSSYDIRITYSVSDIDARILVSMPSGCLAMLPGIALDGRTSVHDESSIDQSKPHQLGPIADALPDSEVIVYTVLGEEACRSRSDSHGQWTLADKALPHGAYLVLYSSQSGFCTRRLLY